MATAVETISASGTITSVASGLQYRPVTGDGGAVSASATPFGTALQWQTGTKIVLKGNHAANTVALAHNDATDGAILNGAAVLGLNDILELMYDSTLERWIEVGRNF